MGAAVGIVAAFFAGCGSSKKTTPPPPENGGLAIFVADSPSCNILSFRGNIRGLTLMRQGGGDAFPFGSLTPPFINVNFASLRDTTTILHIGQTPVGTYDQAKIDFGVAQFSVFDPALTPPLSLKTGTFTEASPTFPIQPPLTVAKGSVAGLRIDLDLGRSIVPDSQGQVTTTLNPVAKLTTITPNDTNGFGTLERMRGFVLSVNNTSTSDFIGGFTFQTLSGSSQVPIFTVSLTRDTQLFGAPALNQLLPGSFVELDGFMDSKGNVVARSVEVQDQENSLQNRLALIGTILSVTKDANGIPIEFGLEVAEEQPESPFTLPLDSVARVKLSASTRYQFSSRSANFASLPFNVTSLAVGQPVVAHGPFTRADDGTFTVAGESVFLTLQTHEGNFSSLVQTGSDDRTGAFFLAPCGEVFQGSPILVVTNRDTAFVNVSGLSALTRQPTLLVKGLLFFDLQGGTANGVTVPPGTLVLIANGVRQLP